MSNLKSLIDTYISSAIMHGEETEKCNSRLANKQYDINNKCFEEIKKYGNEGLNEVVKLMNHENVYVQITAAYRSLFIKPDIAVKKLDKLKKKKGEIGFNAKMILMEWENGNLTGNVKISENQSVSPVQLEKTNVESGKVKEFLDNPNTISREVKFKDIQEFDRMEERFFDVDPYYSNILGMNIDYVEFSTLNEPPLKNEILAWLWVIHPEWKEEILEYADDTLKQLIKDYDVK
jgi:hypothetical protein